MKNLTLEELDAAPGMILQIYISSALNIPMGSKILDEAMDKYPEYFQDEINYKKKWDAIPQCVHDEYNHLVSKVMTDNPDPSKYAGQGLFAWIKNQGEEDYPYEFEKSHKHWEKIRKKINTIHTKTYGPYLK